MDDLTSAKLPSIEKELILPYAIESWEGLQGSKINTARIFKLWGFKYFAILSSIGILLLFKGSLLGIIVLLLSFALDYFVLRARKRENFQIQLKELKELLREGFYKSDERREDPFEFDIGKNKLLDSNPANILRKAWILNLAEKYFKYNSTVLDAGCKGGEISASLKTYASSIYGIDFNRSAIKNFNRRFRGSGVQANILDLPFKSKRFDVVLCTEVIEHLLNPIQGLNQIAEVAKPDGLLILSTDNRNGINFLEVFNPFIVIERVVGLLFPQVLAPRNLIWKWKNKYKIYHAEYSREDLISMIRVTKKYEILSYFSLSFLSGIYRIICRLKPDIKQEDYLKIMFPIEKILVKIPIIRWLGDHWVVILKRI